jgi:hypothetical protein
LKLPGYVKRRLESEFNCVPAEYEHIGQLAHPGSQDVIYAAEKRGRRAAGRLVSDEDLHDVIARLLDAVYVTRIQAERFARPEDAEAARGSYLVDPDVLMRIGKDTTIMHPLPRVNEVDALVDQDARAAYFRQASYGIPIRMALMALLLGGRRLGGRRKSAGPDEALAPRPSPDEYLTGFTCANPTCITNHEPGTRARMEQVGDSDLLRCVYCEHEMPAPRAGRGAR